jgi:uncharacterized protein
MVQPRLLIYLGHPAHYYIFQQVIKHCIANGIPLQVAIKKKDVLEDLLRNENVPYINIMPHERSLTAWGIIKGIGYRAKEVLSIARSFKPTVMAGTSAEIPWVGKLLGIKTYVFNEDDYDVVKNFCRVAYPMATAVVAPNVCNVGKYDYKKTAYNSYHELAYLHPQVFTPNSAIAQRYVDITQPYFILRFSGLGAFHDVGKTGITDAKALQLVKLLLPYGKVYITSERLTSAELAPYQLNIQPIHMHHIMNYATMYIGDSQTMTAEAAVLGVPAYRYNDFVGKLSYLTELENVYQLAKGFTTNNWDAMLEAIAIDLKNTSLKQVHATRLQQLLSEKINAAEFIQQLLLA